MRHWADKWIGIPHADKGRGPEYDCWGLVWAVYRDEFGVAVPSYDDTYPHSRDGRTIQAVIDREIMAWKPCSPHEGDLVILQMLGKRMHCGVCLNAERFLHVLHGCQTVIERLSAPVWRNRVSGIYRHEAML